MFVREHLHRQLAAIDHGFGFGGEQFYQTLFEGVGGSELESLYDLLHSQVFSNPTLKQTTEYLTLLQQQQLSQYGKLFLLLKITSALKSVAMQEMLLLVPEISSLERYWQQRGRSHVSMVRYMFEQLPLQLRKPKQEWFQESLSSVFVGLRSRASVWSILDRNIQQKQKNVKNLLLGYAKQLGFLAQPSVLHHVHGKPSADTKKLANELQGWTRTKSEQVWDKILVQVYWDLLLLEHVSKGDPEDFIVEKRLLRTPSMSDLGGWIARLKQVCTLMHQIRSKAHQSLSLYQRPTLFQRYWLPVTALGLTAIVVHQTLDVNALEVAFWKLVSDGRETVFGFLREWIYKPCVDMVATIRHKEARLAIMGTESLQADLQVLGFTTVSRENGR
ncbi:hypothetical protein EDD86DRAFT_126771 [Gorgonomyces haynaldii]|nr:hypothetical protein EDD86DRAFT_126771 [Gorgonomyces haynaldii]